MKLSKEVVLERILDAIRRDQDKESLDAHEVELHHALLVASRESQFLVRYDNRLQLLSDHFLWQRHVLSPEEIWMCVNGVGSLIEKTLDVHPSVAHLD